jgi:hypothetical protein
MPGTHSLLSPSSSERWLNCPPSARQCENAPESESAYAQQGTDAHSLCEYRLRIAIGERAADPTGSLTFYDKEMSECADDYVSFVLETA